jgi:hypothetical protein
MRFREERLIIGIEGFSQVMSISFSDLKELFGKKDGGKFGVRP